MKSLKYKIVACTWFVTVIAAGAYGQEAKPLSVEDALNTYSLTETSRIAFSPNGEWIALELKDNRRLRLGSMGISGGENARTGLSDTSEGSDVWVVRASDGEAKNLTEGRGSSWEPTWSPDGRFLAFVSDRDGSGQSRLWLWQPATESLRKVSEVAVRVAASVRMCWTPDSKKILVTTLPEGMSVDEYARAVSSVGQSAGTGREKGVGVTLYTSRPTRLSGEENSAAIMTNLDEEYRHDLALIDVVTGASEILVPGNRIHEYSLSHDGLTLVYSVPKRFYRPGSWRVVYDLDAVDLRTKERSVLVADALLVSHFRWSPDDALVAYATAADDRANFYVVGRGGGASRKISLVPKTASGTPGPASWHGESKSFVFVMGGSLWSASTSGESAREVARIPAHTIVTVITHPNGTLWSPDGSTSAVMLVHDDDNKQDGFYRIDLASGKTSRLMERSQCYVMLPFVGLVAERIPVSSKGLIAYVAEDAQHAPDLWISDADFQHPKQLTHLNPQFDHYELGASRLIRWVSDDGKPLNGALLLPAGYKEGKRYPLVVWPHVGAYFSNQLNAFGLGEFPGPFNMQLLATRGYAVLFPDQADDPLEPVSGLVKSVLPGISKVVELGIADPERVGIMGHSMGGYSTLALITRTHRFKTAIELSGSGDFTADYGTMEADGSGYQYLRGESILGGPPWMYPSRYIQSSPIYYLDRVETPLLIVHGTDDRQVSPFLADEIFVALRRLGKETEYAKYEGAGHSPETWSYSDQADLISRITGWFDHYFQQESPSGVTDKARP